MAINSSTNQATMKLHNQKLVLDLVRQGGASRADIAHATGLTRASISLIVDKLIAENVVFEDKVKTNGVGRSSTTLKINADSRFIAGVNITRRDTQVGIINLSGLPLAEQTIKGEKQPPSILLQQAMDIIAAQMKQLNIPYEKLLGVGVSAPGPLDYKTGALLSPTGFSHWRNINIRKAISSAMGLPVILENVSDCLALEERYFGKYESTSNMMVVVIDDGIGAGIIINNKIHRGHKGLGGEIGHISICYNGIQCECGNIGCFEAYASMPAVLKNSGFSSWKQLINQLELDKTAALIFEQEALYIATALASAINLFDLEKVILAGDISYRPQPLLKRVNELVSTRIITDARTRKDFIAVTNRNHSAITACMPVLHEFYSCST